MASTDRCRCGEWRCPVVDCCPLTRLTDGDLSRLHSADDCGIIFFSAKRCSDSTREMKWMNRENGTRFCCIGYTAVISPRCSSMSYYHCTHRCCCVQVVQPRCTNGQRALTVVSRVRPAAVLRARPPCGVGVITATIALRMISPAHLAHVCLSRHASIVTPTLSTTTTIVVNNVLMFFFNFQLCSFSYEKFVNVQKKDFVHFELL